MSVWGDMRKTTDEVSGLAHVSALSMGKRDVGPEINQEYVRLAQSGLAQKPLIGDVAAVHLP